MQSSCIGSLMEIADQDKNVLYLTADSGEGGLDLMFRRNFSERSFNFGIAEQNMVAAAAGLASAGKIPFVYTAAPFLVYRSYEFIRNDVCLQNLPVKLIGTGSGISVSSLGPTHHTTEDNSVLRCLPNLMLLSPATPKQAYECVKKAYHHKGPVYIRLGMNKEKEFFEDNYRLPEDKTEVIRNGCDISVFVTGSILEEAVDAAEILEKKGVSVAVINVPFIKPFPGCDVIKYAKQYKMICSVEEHNVIGGLGSMIADALIENGMYTRLLKIGLEDSFTAGYGKLHQIRKENGLSSECIVQRILEVFT